jgi:hypothetical protein
MIKARAQWTFNQPFRIELCCWLENELEIITLSEVSQTYKDKYHILSFICRRQG